MPAKLTYEQVKSAFEQKGFKLLSNQYESNTSLLDYRSDDVEFHRKRKACEYIGFTFKSYSNKSNNCHRQGNP